MCEAFGRRVIAVGRWNLIAFAELLAGCDHPVGKVEHRAFKAARFISAGFEGKLFKPNLLEFFRDSLSVIFGC